VEGGVGGGGRRRKKEEGKGGRERGEKGGEGGQNEVARGKGLLRRVRMLNLRISLCLSELVPIRVSIS